MASSPLSTVSSHVAADSIFAAHRVATYNVLSSHLSEPSHFVSCAPEHLDPKARLEKVLDKLSTEVDAGSIICLQEVSALWAGGLHTYFAKAGYHFITGLYGGSFNGYMGVGIAVPTARYELADVDITRIADTKKVPRPSPSLLSKWTKPLLSWAAKKKIYTPPIDMWDEVLRRHNQMVSARLLDRRTGRRLVVGTYHMPCMFMMPSVMVTHCALSAQHLQRFAGEDPHVFLGDFNIKPSSSMYHLLTAGTLPTEHPDYPTLVDSWLPDVAPLRSAYALAHGQEPDFTNFAQSRQDPVFIETLDYIFLSKHWEVKAVQKLPNRAEVAGPLPNAEEPSDHMLLAAQISLPEEEVKEEESKEKPEEVKEHVQE